MTKAEATEELARAARKLVLAQLRYQACEDYLRDYDSQEFLISLLSIPATISDIDVFRFFAHS